jgi:hypothetical protein
MRYASALLVALTACCIGLAPSISAAPRAAPPTAGDLRDCRTRGEGRGPQKLPTPPGVRVGPLILWPSLRLRTTRTSDVTWLFVAKAPVVLRARTKLVFAIAPSAVSRAAFQSHRGGYVSAVRFVACRETQQAFAYDGTIGRYTGFPFAIGLKQRSACVPVEVWLDGQSTPIRRVIPVGRRSC